ncbi:MAG: DUF2828 family protein [Clostridia bacterium]|nr:DUF2828 family protein [Clostridia bacterium]
MLEYLKNEANKTYTENGAATYATTNSDCLDLFATIGALRRESESEIITRFIRAYSENRDIAMKLLFFARDIRGGLGERRVFKVILGWLAENEPATLRKNIEFVAEYGRFDDLLVLMNTPCEKDMLEVLHKQFLSDVKALKEGGEVSLLAKWLPSVNASNKETVLCAKRIAKYFGMNDASYRKALVALRAHIRIIENNLREKDYTFDYSKQPSKAMYKYRKAFIRNDGERYGEFISKVSSGEVNLNAKTLMPYEIITPFFNGGVSDEERAAINATWLSQEDFGNNENAIAVIDGSGSMYGWGNPKPITVALSLGIYFAERNTGAFKNHFITFSTNPKLVEIKGEDILDKARYCSSFNEIANTNIQKVFELILNTAKKNHVPQDELPQKIYIISDMEFDYCTNDASLTNFEYAKKLFENAGYKLPDIVFWNVASRNRQQPVTKNEQGVALVSGFTPRLFSMVAGGKLNPYAFMLEVVESERYAKIVA